MYYIFCYDFDINPDILNSNLKKHFRSGDISLLVFKYNQNTILILEILILPVHILT